MVVPAEEQKHVIDALFFSRFESTRLLADGETFCWHRMKKKHLRQKPVVPGIP